MGKTIKIVRGTSNSFDIALQDESGEFYRLKEGEVLRFGVTNQRYPEQILFTKEMSLDHINSSGDAYTLMLAPEDTENLELSSDYRYDVGLQSGEHYYNVIPCSDFKLILNASGRGEI